VGALDREAEFSGLVEAASPDVMFHVLPLRARGVANEADYMWRRNVRGCEALCAALARSKAESLVLVRLWDESRLDEPWALMAALGEALVLNHPDLVRVSPKSARVPPVLTGDEVSRLAGRTAADGAPDERFAMTEGEAAAFVLDAGATHAGRVILVPSNAEFFAASDVIGAILEPGVSPRETNSAAAAAGKRHAADDARPLFPNEIPRPSVVPGAEQVVSPLCPAGAPVLDLVAEPARLVRERIDDCFNALKTELFAGEGAARTAGPRSK
jgi:hypothetical protein